VLFLSFQWLDLYIFLIDIGVYPLLLGVLLFENLIPSSLLVFHYLELAGFISIFSLLDFHIPQEFSFALPDVRQLGF